MAAPQTTATQYAAGNFAANSFAALPPIIPGLQSVVFPRSSPSPNNLVAGGPAFINVGSGPVLETGWGNFTETSAAYDSKVADATAGTLISVAQSPGGAGGFTLFSNLISGGVDFYIEQFGNGVGVTIVGSFNNMEIPVPGGSILNWGFYALTWGPAGVTFNAPTVGIAYNCGSALAAGTPANGNTISTTATGSFSGSPHTVIYTLSGADTLNTSVAALAALVNADSVCIAAGITAGATTNKFGIFCPAGSGITFTTTATGGGISLTYTIPTSTHTVNNAKTFTVGTTVSGNGQGTGSIAAWMASMGSGAQATQAQILQWYRGWQASLLGVGIAI